MGVSESERAGTAPPSTPTLACPAPTSSSRKSTPSASQAAAAAAAAVAAAAAAVAANSGAQQPLTPQGLSSACRSAAMTAPAASSTFAAASTSTSVSAAYASATAPTTAAATTTPKLPTRALPSPRSALSTPANHSQSKLSSSHTSILLAMHPQRPATTTLARSESAHAAAPVASPVPLPPRAPSQQNHVVASSTTPAGSISAIVDAAKTTITNQNSNCNDNDKSTNTCLHDSGLSLSDRCDTDRHEAVSHPQPRSDTIMPLPSTTSASTNIHTNILTGTATPSSSNPVSKQRFPLPSTHHAQQHTNATHPLYPAPPQRIQITIATLTGKRFPIDIYTTNTIGELKYRIFEEEGLSMDQQVLVFREQTLSADNATVAEAGLRNGSTVKLVLHMAGGPGLPLRTQAHASQENTVIFLLCKQNDDIFMLEVHMKEGDSQKTAAKHILRMAEGVSGAKVLQCFDAAEGFEIDEIGELDLDVLRAAVGGELYDDDDEDDDDDDRRGRRILFRRHDDGDEDGNEGQYAGDDNDYDEDDEDDDGEEFEDDPASVFEHSRVARGGRPDSSGSTISTNTFISFISNNATETDSRSPARRICNASHRHDEAVYCKDGSMSVHMGAPRKYQRGGGSAPLVATSGHKHTDMNASVTSSASPSRMCSPVSPASNSRASSSSVSLSMLRGTAKHMSIVASTAGTTSTPIELLLEDAEVVYAQSGTPDMDCEPRRVRLRTAKRRNANVTGSNSKHHGLITGKGATRPATAISIMRLPAGARPMYIIPKSRPASAEQTAVEAILASSAGISEAIGGKIMRKSQMNGDAEQDRYVGSAVVSIEDERGDEESIQSGDDVRVTSPATEAAAAAVAAAGRIIEMVSRDRRPRQPSSPAPASNIAATRTATNRSHQRAARHGNRQHHYQSSSSMPLPPLPPTAKTHTQPTTRTRRGLGDESDTPPSAPDMDRYMVGASAETYARTDRVMEFQSQRNALPKTSVARKHASSPSLSPSPSSSSSTRMTPKQMRGRRAGTLVSASTRPTPRLTGPRPHDYAAATHSDTASVIELASQGRPGSRSSANKSKGRSSVRQRMSTGSTRQPSSPGLSSVTSTLSVSIRKSTPHHIRSMTTISRTSTPITATTSVPVPFSSTSSLSSSRQCCSLCKKKLGPATRFTCRCNQTFCSTHRYTDRHACSFDYRQAAKPALIRENPMVKKDKLVKL